MSKSIAVLANNLQASQTAFYLIDEANNLVEADTATDIVFFVREPSLPCVLPATGIYSTADSVWHPCLHGLATDLESVKDLLICRRMANKWFFVSDFEWVGKRFEYSRYESLYRHPDIKLLIGSAERADFFEKCWNRRPEVVAEGSVLGWLLAFADGDKQVCERKARE